MSAVPLLLCCLSIRVYLRGHFIFTSSTSCQTFIHWKKAANWRQWRHSVKYSVLFIAFLVWAGSDSLEASLMCVVRIIT